MKFPIWVVYLKKKYIHSIVDTNNIYDKKSTIVIVTFVFCPAEQEVASSSLKKAGSLEDLLDTALASKPKPAEPVTTPMVNTEPPPLTDESSDEQDETKNRTKYSACSIPVNIRELYKLCFISILQSLKINWKFILISHLLLIKFTVFSHSPLQVNFYVLTEQFPAYSIHICYWMCTVVYAQVLNSDIWNLWSTVAFPEKIKNFSPKATSDSTICWQVNICWWRWRGGWQCSRYFRPIHKACGEWGTSQKADA